LNNTGTEDGKCHLLVNFDYFQLWPEANNAVHVSSCWCHE